MFFWFFYVALCKRHHLLNRYDFITYRQYSQSLWIKWKYIYLYLFLSKQKEDIAAPCVSLTFVNLKWFLLQPRCLSACFQSLLDKSFPAEFQQAVWPWTEYSNWTPRWQLRCMFMCACVCVCEGGWVSCVLIRFEVFHLHKLVGCCFRFLSVAVIVIIKRNERQSLCLQLLSQRAGFGRS